MIVLAANLEQIENSLIRLEFSADEIECKHQAEPRRLEFAADEIEWKQQAESRRLEVAADEVESKH